MFPTGVTPLKSAAWAEMLKVRKDTFITKYHLAADMLLPINLFNRRMSSSPQDGIDALIKVAEKMLGKEAGGMALDTVTSLMEKTGAYTMAMSDGRMRDMWNDCCKEVQPQTKTWWDLHIGAEVGVWKVMNYLNGLRVSRASVECAFRPPIKPVCDTNLLSSVNEDKLAHIYYRHRALNSCKQCHWRTDHLTLEQAATGFGDEHVLDAAKGNEEEEARLQLADEQVSVALEVEIELGPPLASEFDKVAAGQVPDIQAAVIMLDQDPWPGTDAVSALVCAITCSVI